jgi:single-strand DNA-binding protein
MGTTNKVILLGHLGADPELRYTATGRAICTLSVATDDSYRNKEGQRQERVTWHRVIAWDKQGELCKEYLSKGRQVYLEGRLDHSSYMDPQGIKRFITRIITQRVVFLNNMKGANGTVPSAVPLEEPYSMFSPSESHPPREEPLGTEPIEDLPF